MAFTMLLLLAITLTSCHSSKKATNQRGGYEQGIETGAPALKGNKTQKAIVSEAMTWLGTPYAYAKSEKGKGTDCSGMVMKVYETVMGCKLPRNSAHQAEFCEVLSEKEVELGDLVFFATGKDEDRISHVGIMIDKVNFVHASASKGVVVSKVNSPYYIRTFKMYGRIPN